jgi:hypothetical protein
MGYDLYITRKKDLDDEDGPLIAADEWLAYIATDPQLHLDQDSESHAVTIDIQSENPEPMLEWVEEGDIYTKDPDLPVIAKMLEIAAALRAKVQGLEGEIFRSANWKDIYYED